MLNDDSFSIEIGIKLCCMCQWLISIKCQLAVLVMLTAFCGPILHCDNHSLAFFKDWANPPAAPTAACFVPSTGNSHLIPASCCQLLPGHLLSQVSKRAHRVLQHGHVPSTVVLRWSCQILISAIEIISQVKPRGGGIYYWLENVSSMLAVQCPKSGRGSNNPNTPLQLLKCP